MSGKGYLKVKSILLCGRLILSGILLQWTYGVLQLGLLWAYFTILCITLGDIAKDALKRYDQV